MSAASCIIFNKDRTKILLIKRRDVPVWVIPGGGIEPGESPEEAALREAHEETGLNVTIVRKIALYKPVNCLTSLTHVYECSPVSGELKTGEETKAIDYFSLNDLPEAFPHFYKYWIEDALTNPSVPYEKAIQGTTYWHLLKYLLTHPLLTLRFLLTKCGIHINT